MALRLAFIAGGGAEQIGDPAGAAGGACERAERGRLSAAGGRREAADVVARGRAGGKFAAAADGGKRGVLARRTARLDRVEIAAVAGDDAGGIGQGPRPVGAWPGA